jgi:hypothetical protein
MIKLNRIGNKLGLAGAVGVLLAVGMMVNQITTESTVGAANDGADRSQRVADSTLSAQLNLRQMQLAVRGIRLARSQSEVEKGAAEARQFAKLEAKDMEAALAIAQRPETRERLQKIKTLMESYTAGTEELAKAQSDLLAQLAKRSAISGEWTKAIEAQLSSPMLERLPNRPDIEKLLLQRMRASIPCWPRSGGLELPVTSKCWGRLRLPKERSRTR